MTQEERWQKKKSDVRCEKVEGRGMSKRWSYLLVV